MRKHAKEEEEAMSKCLSETDCVEVEKRPYLECAGEKVPCITSECVGLRETHFICKRGQVDMRARIRGNKGYYNHFDSLSKFMHQCDLSFCICNTTFQWAD